MNYSKLHISLEQAQEIAFNTYNIEGLATKLPGEIDFNFKIDTDKKSYLLKISRPDESLDALDFQIALFEHLEKNTASFQFPRIIKDTLGNSLSEITDSHNQKRKIRMHSWLDGRLWSQVNPQLDDLRFSLGQEGGFITKALQEFNHPYANRKFDWDTSNSLWTKGHLQLFSDEEKNLISHFQYQFENQQTSYTTLRKSVIHNDANDNNVLVSNDLLKPKVNAIIDYGDAVYSQIINDVAVSCAYACMHHNDPLEAALPLIKGYHSSFELREEELAHLYCLIAMRLVISVTKSALNKIAEPDNSYLLISERPAWELLKKWRDISADFAHYSFRNACGYEAHPKACIFNDWAANQSASLSQLFPTINKENAHLLDLSVASTWVGQQEDFNNLDLFQFKITQLQKTVPDKILAGGYLEARALYTSSEYDKIGNSGSESRSIHLGVDFWLAAQTPVHALFEGEVVTAHNDAGDKEYGGLIILKHTVKSLTFFTLYGHLTVASANSKKVGDLIKQGDCIGYLGNYPENGNWAPHLHFQIMLSLFDYTIDFPGVAYHRQLEVWKSCCPDPNLIFGCAPLNPIQSKPNTELIDFRKEHLGKSLSLQYKTPIKIVRGAGAYLIDENGKKYLDTVNNVAHVGHEHPSVVKAGQGQMALLNTNSRYLHDNINILAKELLETLPPALNVFHFVNSGSEANELAIRMLKAATGEKDIIASEYGYHGNTNMCVDISSYKFDGTGGQGAPEHTHIIPLPDSYRGKYQGENTGALYAEEVQKQITKIHEKGRGLGGFIIESIISCGGQIELPEGFLKQAYSHVRKAGGICIADEVQVGCGRTGKAFWGFQLHDVVPDIVTIGKPIGNGHPLAVVVCTQEVASKFANGMEYFNTFGGNPVSCAIGTEVLKTIKKKHLQEHAQKVGEFLKGELTSLSKEFTIIGEVRGQGLFLGIELVDADKKPLAAHTDYLANRMKDHGILMSTDGPDHNVLKIKPPMVFSLENAEELIYYLRKILAEDVMKLPV